MFANVFFSISCFKVQSYTWVHRKEVKRKTTEVVCGCIEGVDGEGWCEEGARDRVRWTICCGDPLRISQKKGKRFPHLIKFIVFIYPQLTTIASVCFISQATEPTISNKLNNKTKIEKSDDLQLKSTWRWWEGKSPLPPCHNHLGWRKEKRGKESLWERMKWNEWIFYNNSA